MKGRLQKVKLFDDLCRAALIFCIDEPKFKPVTINREAEVATLPNYL